jgi:ABC-2 type transport system permease protein
VNLDVFAQSLRQVRKSLIAVGLGVAVFFYLILLSSSSFATDSGVQGFLREPPRAVEALMGGSVNFLHPSGWVAAGMSHLLTLSLFTASALMIASGAVATEVERGTIDLVLTRPVRRTSFLAGKAAASLVAVTFVEAMGFVSALIARLTIDKVDDVAVAELARAFLGSWLLFSGVAMVALLISALSSLRGRATGAGVGVVVAFFFVNFIALLIDQLYGLRFLSPFHYFRPAEVMMGDAMAALWVLGALAVVAAATAMVTFASRDIRR